MQNVLDWFHTTIECNPDSKAKPWLILGKGPSFSKRKDYDISQFLTLSLNHAVREQSVTVAHLIDFDVFTHCADAIAQNAQVLLMPWIPHINNKPGNKTLAQLVEETPALKALDDQDRLLWYNLSTGKIAHQQYPVIRSKYFSAIAALNVLINCGVKQVRSLGIDGGVSYGSEFSDLHDLTCLANGQTSFDCQFGEIARIIQTSKIHYAPLDIEAPVRVYVGSTEPQMLAVKVLAHSIRKHASLSVEVYPLFQSEIPIPLPKDPAKAPRTPFSFQRFIIPQWAGFTGRAIYMDSDMQVFSDIRALWTLPFYDAQVLAVGDPQDPKRRPQFSVMLMDCKALQWRIPELIAQLDSDELSYEQLVYQMAAAEQIRADVPPQWNCLEHYEPDSSALVHYTDMTIQPWLSRKNPLCGLWVQGLLDALDDGDISLTEIAEHVAKGYVRPSLLYQARHRIIDPKQLPPQAKWLDKDYVPPHLLDKKPRSSFKTLRYQVCQTLSRLI